MKSQEREDQTSYPSVERDNKKVGQGFPSGYLSTILRVYGEYHLEIDRNTIDIVCDTTGEKIGYFLLSGVVGGRKKLEYDVKRVSKE